MKEQGKTLAEAYGEIDKSIAFIDYMSSLSMSNKGEVLQNSVENEIIQIGNTLPISEINPINVQMKVMIAIIIIKLK